MKINITFDLAPFLPWLRDYDKEKNRTLSLLKGWHSLSIKTP